MSSDHFGFLMCLVGFSTLVARYENQAPFWGHGATQMKPLVRKFVGLVNGEVFWRQVRHKPQPYPVFKRVTNVKN